MKRTDPKFAEIAQQIAQGKLTRQEASDLYSIKYNTLCQWLLRSGMRKDDNVRELGVKAFEFTASKTRYGAALAFNVIDESAAERLNKALEKVLAYELSCLAASKLFGVSATTLTTRARRAREALGLPTKRVRTKQMPK